jgi:hypothetical protein
MHPLIGLRLPKPVRRKLQGFATETCRSRSHVVALLVMNAEALPDGGLRVAFLLGHLKTPHRSREPRPTGRKSVCRESALSIHEA